MYSSSHQRMLHTSSKTIITWLFLITIVLYTLYSSNIILFHDDQEDCTTPTTKENLQISNTSSETTETMDTTDEGDENKKPLVDKLPRPREVVVVDNDGDGDDDGGGGGGDGEVEAEVEAHAEEETNKEGEEYENNSPVVLRLTPKQMYGRQETDVKHIVFGIAGSSNLWHIRKEYIKIWWRPNKTRGVVWLDQKVKTQRNEGLPEIHISGDTSKFRYTNRQGQRSALRISRVVTETLKLGMKDVRWFVMGDDDTVFMVDNVVRILSKYNHKHFYYIGSSSESHVQNMHFSYAMAYGGGGFAISYPLAQELAKMQDRCIQRYPSLYGSDDRIQACMAELGVPLTKEAGFHQYDVYGDLLGLLGAHPVAPLVSLHHLDVVQPIFPRMTRVLALKHLMRSVNQDSGSIMQQSICYDKHNYWSISVSWGYVVQILRGVLSPREMEMPSRTFLNWYRRADYTAYAFNTRPVARHPCQKPFVYYMSKTHFDPATKQVIGIYNHDKSKPPFCRWRMNSPEKITSVVVTKKPDPSRWKKSPRRDCCRILSPQKKATTLYLWVGNCHEGEVTEL